MGLFSKLAGSFVKNRVSNTSTALQIIVEDFKKYVLILKWVFLGFSVATLVYGIVSKTGHLIINIALLALLAVYAVLDTVLRIKQKTNMTKRVRMVYAWTRILLNAGALGSSLYSLYYGTADVRPTTIVLATLSIILFVLKILVEVGLEVFQNEWTILKNAMIMDAKEHPNTSAKIFSPIIGDVEELEAKESVVKRIREKQFEE